MSEILKCYSLTKCYGDTTALNEIDLSIESGKIIGLLGPNGSGKTTLIKLINGLLTPTKGCLTIDGNEPGVETKKIVAYLPDNIFVNDWMRIEQIVTFFADFYADFRVEVAYEMMSKLGISPRAQLRTLSKGNK